jgi:hypothetical protein
MGEPVDTSLDSLTPDTQERAAALLRAAAGLGYGVSVRSTRRSCEEQEKEWLEGHGARTSWHTAGRALDVTLVPGECVDYARLGALWESWGGVWGGRWRGEKYGPCGDMGHFQWTPGMPTVGPECTELPLAVQQTAAGLAGFVLGAGTTLVSFWWMGRGA